MVDPRIAQIFVSRASSWLGGVVAGLSLIIENDARRTELAMHVLPRALECTWLMLQNRGLVFQTGQYGEAWVS